MWVITHYTEGKINMFEFDKKEEAKKAFQNIKGTKILSEIIYFNDPCFL